MVKRTVAIVCLLGGFSAAVRGEGPSVAEMVGRAQQYLLSRLDPRTGLCLEEFDPRDAPYGGRTGLCAYALLSSGLDPRRTPPLRQAMRRLAKMELRGTYAVAMRAAALAAAKRGALPAKTLLRRDVDWLIQAAYANGAYTAVSARGKSPGPEDSFDNTHSQWAVLGVFAGARHGVPVPAEYWRRVEEYWWRGQQPDGGWGYQPESRDARQVRSYGSQTAAAVATLSICQERLAGFRAAPGSSARAAMDRGLAWLEKNLSVDHHPRKNAEWYYLWLFQLGRVGEVAGFRYLGGIHWYSAAVERLRRLQNPDGSWGEGPRTEETCLALLFLAGGETPILWNKLCYDGPWNLHPRDAAEIVRRLGYLYERPLGWQVLDLRVASPAGRTGWSDGRVAWLSGAGTLELSAEQIDRLRKFVFRGGIIFSQAVRDDAAFTASVRRLAARAFPFRRWASLPAKHPLYTLAFSDAGPRDLESLDNGLRPLWIHSPRDLSAAMEEGNETASRSPAFRLLANLYLYLTEKGAASPRGFSCWDEPLRRKKYTRLLSLARVWHGGNCDPEPGATEWLKAELARDGVKLVVSDLLPWEKISAERFPVAYLTGTEAFTLSRVQRQSLQAYLAGGGTLLIDAAGSRRAFVEAVRREVLAPLGGAAPLPSDARIFAAGPNSPLPFRYRRSADRRGENEQDAPRLEAVFRNGRPVVIFSPDDLAAGLVGYPLYGLEGFRPDTARALMRRLVLFAVGD